MAAYDFTGLAPADFELLCHDLLESTLGVPLQAFVTGRDRGIDLRHAPANGCDWIVQCKHFVRSGFPKLRSHMLKKELPRIEALRPTRYVLATSVGLSPSNVDDLFAILSPHCQSKHDILGQEDLNALIRANPAVEQGHFKLWLTSAAVLSRLMHNDVFVQSILTEDQIRQRLGLYVYTHSFEAARRKLDDEHVCILSGLPGVGKTTLAEMLLVEYLMQDWQIVTIHQNVAEGQRLFEAQSDTRQVFYYDDFLGQISTGEKLGKNEDRALLQLIGAVSRTGKKRFILTTREYILAQAKAEHEHLARSKIDIYRFVVSCDDYSELDKARILANHLYFAHVPQDHIASVVETRAYQQIITHRNYNPRIVEWMTQVTETAACGPSEYPSVFVNRLDNPSDLWAHAFENQIGEASRHVLLALGSCGNGILLADLQEAFEKFYVERGKRFGFPASPSSFRRALDELEGNFIRIERGASQLVVSCHNPSILDFLNQRLLLQRDEGIDVLRYAVFFEQVNRLFRAYCMTDAEEEWTPICSLDPTVMREAIDRTLVSRSVRLSRIEGRADKWWRNPFSVWERLRICCDIGSAIRDRKLQIGIEEHIDGHLKDADPCDGELSEVMLLLDAIDNCEWLGKQAVDRWTYRLWDQLLAMEHEFAEPLDGLSATAQWFVRKRQQFQPQQAEMFERNLTYAIGNEVTDNSDRSDPERLGGDLAILQELAKTIGWDFRREIEWLNEAIADCDPPDREDNSSAWRKSSQTEASSIEAIFESLLE